MGINSKLFQHKPEKTHRYMGYNILIAKAIVKKGVCFCGTATGFENVLIWRV